MQSKLWFVLSLIFATIILATGSYVYFLAPDLLEIPLDTEALESTVMVVISSFGGTSGLYLIVANQLKSANQLALTNGKISNETYIAINGKLDTFIQTLTTSQNETNSQISITNETLTYMAKRLDANETEIAELLKKIEERDAKITAILGDETHES
jgi:hypothetical protein